MPDFKNVFSTRPNLTPERIQGPSVGLTRPSLRSEGSSSSTTASTGASAGASPAQPEKPSSPSDIYAEIHRGIWADQQARYLPLEKMVNEMVLDPEKRSGIRQQGLDTVTASVDESFNRGANRLETLRSRTNQRQSARGQRSSERLDALSRTATTVSARNGARSFMDETEDRLLGG